MSDINIVQLHSTVLFNISDHITRQSDTKFGVLLGTTDKNTVIVKTSFELLFDRESNLNEGFLVKRMGQFSTVFPQYYMVGFYQLKRDLIPSADTLSVFGQIMRYQKLTSVLPVPVMFTLINSDSFNNPQKCEPFKSYLYDKIAIPLHTTILTNETENISNATITNFPNYFSSDVTRDANDINNDFKLERYNEELSISVNQLYSKVELIIKYLQNRLVDVESMEKEVRINNLITHLSSMIHSLQKTHTIADNKEQVQTTKLSLLTAQLLALDNLQSQIAKNIIRFSIHTNPQSIESFKH